MSELAHCSQSLLTQTVASLVQCTYSLYLTALSQQHLQLLQNLQDILFATVCSKLAGMGAVACIAARLQGCWLCRLVHTSSAWTA